MGSGSPVAIGGVTSRSARVVSRSVLTIENRTRVHRSFVGQVWLGLDSLRADDRSVRGLGDALDRGDGPLERLDHLGHRDLARRAREHVAAARSAPARDQPGLAQPRDEVLQVREGQPVVGRDLRERNWVVAGAPSELDHHAHAVLGLG